MFTACKGKEKQTDMAAMPDLASMSTLSLTYAAGSPHQVDVWLIDSNKNDKKLASLAPGQQIDVELPAGEHQLEYHYWTSDPNTTKGRREISKKRSHYVEGREKPISVKLKARQKILVQIPLPN